MNFVTKTAFFFKKHLQGLYLFTSFHEFSGARTHKLFLFSSMPKETCKNVLVHHLFGIPVKTLNKSRVCCRFKGYHRFGKMNDKRHEFDFQKPN